MFSCDDQYHIAWDIETTGLSWSDRIIASGFWLPHGAAEVVLNTSGGRINPEVYEPYLRDHCGCPITIHPVTDEKELLNEMGQIIFERFEREANRLVGYNADSWQGGFDLPFLRSACLRCGMEWIFDGLEFIDLWEVVKKRLNTTETTRDKDKQRNVHGLDEAHTILCSESNVAEALDSEMIADHPWFHDHDYDPFLESSEVVTFFNRGEYLPVVQHNMADIHRTWELGEVIREFASPNDLTSKKL